MIGSESTSHEIRFATSGNTPPNYLILISPRFGSATGVFAHIDVDPTSTRVRTLKNRPRETRDIFGGVHPAQRPNVLILNFHFKQ